MAARASCSAFSCSCNDGSEVRTEEERPEGTEAGSGSDVVGPIGPAGVVEEAVGGGRVEVG